jgi:adenylate cyclase class 2
METEYEATFANINKAEIRERLKKSGASLVKPEFLQKRIPFHLPKDKRSEDVWLRVRDEGDKVTLSLKSLTGEKIENQKELCLQVDNFDSAVELLKSIGCEPKSYQETKRELWKLGETEITIDEWPFLEPFVEVEAKSEQEVREASEKIGFNYNDALFCEVTKLYKMKYGDNAPDVREVKKLIFEAENPFTNL